MAGGVASGVGSVVSGVGRVVRGLEELVLRDDGGRGVTKLVCWGDLLASAEAIAGGSRLGILTGFPCVLATPPTENDGLSGALALARVAVVRGGRATVVTDASNAAPVWAGLSALGRELGVAALQRSVRARAEEEEGEARLVLVSVPNGREWRKEEDEARLLEVAAAHDHWVAIERAGRSASGSWRTMRGRAMDALVAPLDVVFEWDGRKYGTTGIGDGGNELGMGKVVERVREFIARGEEIACVVKADHLVAAGVSNWGGWALAAAVALVDRSKRSGAVGEEGYDVVGALPSDEAEGVLEDVMSDAGARDGISGAAGRSVDNLPFETHLGILQSIRSHLRA